MTNPASDFLFDIEPDLRSAADLGHAIYLMLEPAGGLSEQDACALMRVASHLQDHLGAILTAWNAAVTAEQEQASLRPAA
jgi:hypothetical protein